MTVDYRDGISILEVIAYVPSLFMAVLMAWRHGFSRSSGWLFFIIFSLLRLIGNACNLATINNPDNINLYVTWAVCSSIGISPLTLALIAILSRCNDSIQRRTGNAFPPIIFRIVGLLTLVALILSIVGVTTTDNPLDGITNAETKSGLLLFLVSWVGLVGLTLLVVSRYGAIEQGEHRLLWAVIVCLPVLLVRLIYSLLSTFKHDYDFNMITGNVTIQLVMVVLEEIFIVYVVLSTGLTLDMREKAVYEPTVAAESGVYQQNDAEMQQQPYDPQKNVNAPAATPRSRPKRPFRGPIHMLYYFIADRVQK